MGIVQPMHLDPLGIDHLRVADQMAIALYQWQHLIQHRFRQ